jgi:hypothetical protein
MDTCPICLEYVDETDIPCENCKTKFHEQCINEWQYVNNSCPVCRHVVIDIPPQSTNDRNYLRERIFMSFFVIVLITVDVKWVIHKMI